jgi:hypothetical protein
MADASAASTGKAPPELTSILSQVQTLQSDRERLIRELEDAKSRVSKLQVLYDTPLPYAQLLFLFVSFACLVLTVRVLMRHRRVKEKR